MVVARPLTGSLAVPLGVVPLAVTGQPDDGVALVVGDAEEDGQRMQDDGRAGLAGATDPDRKRSMLTIDKVGRGVTADANKLSDMPDFNDASKLGSGKEMVDRLTKPNCIFENRDLDFSKNGAEG